MGRGNGRDEAATRNKKRRHNDVNYRLSTYLRSRVYHATKLGFKNGSAVADLGCSIEEFKQYIERQFQPRMSWDNYGEWHLDHIIPLSSFDLTNREQFLKACHYTNYQPLWAKDNLSKSDSLSWSKDENQ